MMNSKNRTGGIDNMRKVFVLVLVSLIVMLTMPLMFTNVALANATDACYINITADEAKQMMDENQSIVILDVGTSTEYKSGHIDGSKLITLLELEERINAIDGNSAVIVYCGSGVKSEKAGKILIDHGFDKVYNIMGGLNAWQDAGFPVVSGSTANQITPSNDSLSSEIEDILNSGKPVFLFLYVDWCHFCQQQIPIIDKLEQEYNGKITFIRVNCEMHPDAMTDLEARGYPSMFLIMGKGKDGQYESQYFKGFTDRETLKRSIYWIIANGSINENSKDNELGIGASPMVLIDNEDYTVTLAGAASCPSSPPGFAPRDPGIASGALCRGACGGDCPSTCRALPDISICTSDGKHICKYRVIECGSHQGCRDHDDCYDNCATAFWPAACRRGCDLDCISTYGIGNCNSWRTGGGPYDSWLKFSYPPVQTACEEPTPYCIDGKCVECRTNADCDDDDGWYPNGDNCEYRNYFCDLLGGCDYVVTDTLDCNQHDGWYYTDDNCEYRDYFCDLLGGCDYVVTDTLDCNQHDGWYYTDDNCEYRDYFCDLLGGCDYVVTDYRDADLYDGWYSDGDNCEYRDYYYQDCDQGILDYQITDYIECDEDYWDCVDSSTVGLYHCTCVDGSLYWDVIDTYDCLEGEECVDGECQEVPEFPAGVTAVFGATFFIFLMMRRKYVER